MPTETATPASPALTRRDVPGLPRALVLMLHGGTETSTRPVDGRSASWRRSAAMQRAITDTLHESGVSTWLVGYRQRGWNGGAPVEDARWALDEVRRELGRLPVVLLGHSMGARTAVHVADDVDVVGVVGLAPWLPEGEPVGALAGKRLLAAHGRRDHITSPRATRAYVERAARVAAEVDFVDMGPVGHYLLKRVRAWNDLAARASLALL